MYIIWTDRKTNVELLEMLGEKRKMVETIVRRKKWIGHILRGESMPREIMEEEWRGREDTEGGWECGMLGAQYDGESYGTMKRSAEDRIVWKLNDANNLPFVKKSHTHAQTHTHIYISIKNRYNLAIIQYFTHPPPFKILMLHYSYSIKHIRRRKQLKS